MDTNNITLYNVIRNGYFDEEHPEYSYLANNWNCKIQTINGVSRPVASRILFTDDDDAYYYGLSVDVKKYHNREAYYLPVGVFQTLYLPRASSESELTVEFDVKLIRSGSLSTPNCIEVWFFNATNCVDYTRHRFLVNVGEWTTCRHTFKVDGSDVYYLYITGYFSDEGNSPLIGTYEDSSFNIRRVSAKLTNCTGLVSSVVENGDFSKALSTGWDVVDGENGAPQAYCSKKTRLEENGKSYLNIKSTSYYTTTLKQDLEPLDVHPEDESKCHADFHFSYRINNKSTQLCVRLKYYNHANYGIVLEKTIECDEDSLGKWKKLSFSSQDLDMPIPYCSGETRWNYVSIEFYISNKSFTNISSGGVDFKYDIDITDVKFDIFNEKEVSVLGEFGIINYPYTYKSGRRLYKDSSIKFKLYSGKSITNSSIYREEKELDDGSYEQILYLIDANEYFCKEGFNGYDNKTFFTFSDGRIAFDEQFIYEWKVYRADGSGECTFIRNKLYYIDIIYKTYKVNSRRVETIVGTDRLELSFPEQNSAVSMTVIGVNGDSVFKRIEITPGTKSNIIDITTEYGLDELIISYIDEDGDEVVSKVTISVVGGEYEYSEEVNIDIISDVHYVALDSSFTIPYIIRPRLAVTVDVDWISSNESVAIVDVFGNIKPMSIGTCTITAINYNTGALDTCELHIVNSIYPPTSIDVSRSHVEIGIEDSVFIETTVRAAYDFYPTSQEVKWESENPSIAKVDKGYIIGTGQGTTNVYCYSYEDPSVRQTIVVNVSGEVTAIKDIELDIYETMLNADTPSRYEYIGWTFVPRNTNQTEVVWSSSDTNIVKVAANGRLSIGDSPILNTPVLIKCTSVSNPEIYRECEVEVVSGDSYIPTIKMKDSYIRTYVGKTVNVSYGISSGYDIQQASIESAYDGSSTSNTATINSADKKIQLDIKQSGEYILTISYVSDDVILASKTCRLIIYEANIEPQFIRNLDVKYSFFNGSYILSYFAVDSDDDLNLTHYINIDDEDYFSSVSPQLMLYEGNEYFYIFGDGLDPGSHSVKMKVVDSNSYESISETKTIIIPSNDNNKVCLSEAKGTYDEIKNDLIDVLERIIKDDKMSVDDKREFTTRYKSFNIGYESLLEILDTCVKHINSQIETSQLEIATIAEDLNTDAGVAIVAYSEGDYTNANFDNVTDMDYYQNECIKALTQRILELEARLNALSNNNNN